MLLAVCIMMTALSYAHGLSTELFGTRYADALRNIESILGKPAKKNNNFAVATYNDTCVISMTSPFVERDCEMYFFRKLAEAGIDIAVESDIWEDKE